MSIPSDAIWARSSESAAFAASSASAPAPAPPGSSNAPASRASPPGGEPARPEPGGGATARFIDAAATRAVRRAGNRLEGPGRTIGPYKLLQLLGEGGFGSVYMAEQQHRIRRKVAVKIVKPGMDTREVIARFEAERQALAVLDHPNIARVLDAGVTPVTQRPYFAMELVRGAPITDYCDENRLDTRERIDLFARVCSAVQHAHQKGIIHRDLKPTNVLVALHDGKPVPKVIDFGIAKAMHQRLTDKTLVTAQHQLVGTPEYMSPEQAGASGLDIDTRSDVYALGVLLYELLTGATPFAAERLRSCSMAEVQRIIRDENPGRPSARAIDADVARVRGTDAASLARLLRGDLDWVVMKTIEKDRRRRYATANDLAADLHRFLRREPVVAGPPSLTYRARKFVDRHRALATVTALLAILLTGSAIGMTFLAIGQARAHAEADREAAIGRTVSEFLTRDLLQQAHPNEAGRDVTVREVLDRAEKAVGPRFVDQPELAASVRHALGKTYLGLGALERAETLLDDAHRAFREQLGDDDVRVLRAAADLASVYWAQGRHEESLPLIEKTLARQRARLGDDHPDTLRSVMHLANACKGQGRMDEAQALLRDNLAARRRVQGVAHVDTLTTQHNLAVLYTRRGRFDDAEPLITEAARLRARLLGREHPDTISSENALAMLYQYQGRYEVAERTMRNALTVRRRILGVAHPVTIGSLNNLGYLFSVQGRSADALPFYEEALARRRAVLGDDNADTLLSMNNLGLLYLELDRPDEADALLVEMLETTRRVMPPGHADIAYATRSVGELYRRTGRVEEATRLLTDAVDGLSRALGERHWDVGKARLGLGRCYAATGRTDEAIATVREALDIYDETFGPHHDRTHAVRRTLDELERGGG